VIIRLLPIATSKPARLSEPRTAARDDLARDVRANGHRAGERNRHQARVEGAISAGVLPVERVEEQEPGIGGERDDRDQGRA
jgi:hypothetical protein